MCSSDLFGTALCGELDTLWNYGTVNVFYRAQRKQAVGEGGIGRNEFSGGGRSQRWEEIHRTVRGAQQAVGKHVNHTKKP